MNLISTLAPERRRWTSLFVVCLAQLMIVLDVTIVNVALPSIQRDLHFSQANLTWVVNAFLITFGSFLLLAGRLGDLVGRKRIFLGGLVIFTLASVICGVAPSSSVLIGARFLQGIGAAAQASVILAIIITEFPEVNERARAMSAYVFVSVAGGSLGLLAGGLLTQTLSWHWLFFVNLPIGVATFALGRALIRADRGLGLEHGVDWLGSLLVTASLMSSIYAIVEATAHGWISAQVLGFGGLGAVLMAAFLTLEARIENPIMPLRILRLRGLVNASLVRGVLVTGMYSTFFPTVFRACFLIGVGMGTAFTPLLTTAMAEVPAADAGLGSGITNVSQQISGALGLAVLSTLATNHTKGLLADHHGVTSSLLGGYHLAFFIGAATIAAGIVLAFALLRPRDPRSELQLADAPANLDMERQAA